MKIDEVRRNDREEGCRRVISINLTKEGSCLLGKSTTWAHGICRSPLIGVLRAVKLSWYRQSKYSLRSALACTLDITLRLVDDWSVRCV